MKTNIGLKALGEPFQNTVHVDPVRVCPRMLEVFFQSLAQWIWDLMESDELSDS
jgi:hypothetical protein